MHHQNVVLVIYPEIPGVIAAVSHGTDDFLAPGLCLLRSEDAIQFLLVERLEDGQCHLYLRLDFRPITVVHGSFVVQIGDMVKVFDVVGRHTAHTTDNDNGNYNACNDKNRAEGCGLFHIDHPNCEYNKV